MAEKDWVRRVALATEFVRSCLTYRYIMEAAKSLRDDFDGDVPKTAKELQSLKGVGPKMAYLCLQAAWGMYDFGSCTFLP